VNRRQFPLVQKIKSFQADPVRLVAELTDRFSESFVDVKTSNQSLCLNNEGLTDSVYDHYEQVNLTVFNEKKFENFKHSDPYKKLLSKKFFDNPKMDEYLYDRPSDSFEGSYFKQVVDEIPGQTIRARLVKLKPGKSIPFHVDYDVRYATRLVVPIVTNSKVKNLFIRDGREHAFHLKADGSAYFLNVGYSHSVENQGDEERVVLMFSKDRYDFLEPE